MLTRVLTVAAATIAAAASTLPSAPAASAALTSVNSCAVTATDERKTCEFIATPGNYVVTITGNARYAWAEAVCSAGGYVFVGKWDYQGTSRSQVGFLAGGTCVLTVASDRGTSTGTVTPYV